MKSKDSEKILSTDDRAATYVTNLKGWVCRNGMFFGEDERSARYNGATHIKCNIKGCDELIKKYDLACDKCASENYINQFKKLQIVDYKNEDCEVIFSDLLEEYFVDIPHLYERISEYCIEHNIDKDEFDETMFRLQPCEEVKLTEIKESDILNEDSFCDHDVELSRDILLYLELLNKEINNFKTNVYEYKNKRLSKIIDVDNLYI